MLRKRWHLTYRKKITLLRYKGERLKVFKNNPWISDLSFIILHLFFVLIFTFFFVYAYVFPLFWVVLGDLLPVIVWHSLSSWAFDFNGAQEQALNSFPSIHVVLQFFVHHSRKNPYLLLLIRVLKILMQNERLVQGISFIRIKRRTSSLCRTTRTLQ